jgi:hypothetical protein
MNMIPIRLQSGIEIPHNNAVVDRVPWHRIKVGQSFPVTKKAFGECAVERLLTAISYRQKATTERYSVRKMPDGSYRCWRLA